MQVIWVIALLFVELAFAQQDGRQQGAMGGSPYNQQVGMAGQQYQQGMGQQQGNNQAAWPYRQGGWPYGNRPQYQQQYQQQYQPQQGGMWQQGGPMPTPIPYGGQHDIINWQTQQITMRPVVMGGEHDYIHWQQTHPEVVIAGGPGDTADHQPYGRAGRPYTDN